MHCPQNASMNIIGRSLSFCKTSCTPNFFHYISTAPSGLSSMPCFSSPCKREFVELFLTITNFPLLFFLLLLHPPFFFFLLSLLFYPTTKMPKKSSARRARPDSDGAKFFSAMRERDSRDEEERCERTEELEIDEIFSVRPSNKISLKERLFLTPPPVFPPRPPPIALIATRNCSLSFSLSLPLSLSLPFRPVVTNGGERLLAPLLFGTVLKEERKGGNGNYTHEGTFPDEKCTRLQIPLLRIRPSLSLLIGQFRRINFRLVYQPPDSLAFGSFRWKRRKSVPRFSPLIHNTKCRVILRKKSRPIRWRRRRYHHHPFIRRHPFPGRAPKATHIAIVPFRSHYAN